MGHEQVVGEALVGHGQVLTHIDSVERIVAVTGQAVPKRVQFIFAGRTAELYEVPPSITVFLRRAETRDAMQWLMDITNEVKQPGQIVRLQCV